MNHDPKLGLHDTYYANSCFLSSIPKDYAYITNRIRIISPKEENYFMKMLSERELKIETFMDASRFLPYGQQLIIRK